jgi:hypothetical protein
MVTRKGLIIAILATFCLTSTLFMIRPTRSNPGIGEYDPWVDLNDDGAIDIFDAITLARVFGTSGTPINKTALLLDLEARIDILNATVMSLSESTQQVYSDLLDKSSDASGQLRIIYPANMFTKPPNLSITASFRSSGYAQMSHITIVENTKDNCTIYLEDGVGSPLSSTMVQISYVAVENKTLGLSIGSKHYANTEQKITSGRQITITFPVGMFTEPPHLSAVVLLMNGAYAGKMCYIQSMSVSTTSATLDLQVWDGGTWQNVADSLDVQVSYTAVET